MKKYYLFFLVVGLFALSACSLNGNSQNKKVVPSVSKELNSSVVVQNATTSNLAKNIPTTTVDKVLIDAKHGIKIFFPTPYVFGQGTSSRIYFGSKITEKVCKDQSCNGCPSGVYSEETSYSYTLDFVPPKSALAILKDLTVNIGSDGVKIYRNKNGEVPQTEKINGHDVVSYLAEGDGDSTYVMEVVGDKFNYVFRSGVTSTGLTATSTFDYIREVVKNIEYLK